jgi:hypothetical protein
VFWIITTVVVVALVALRGGAAARPSHCVTRRTGPYRLPSWRAGYGSTSTATATARNRRLWRRRELTTRFVTVAGRRHAARTWASAHGDQLGTSAHRLLR